MVLLAVRVALRRVGGGVRGHADRDAVRGVLRRVLGEGDAVGCEGSVHGERGAVRGEGGVGERGRLRELLRPEVVKIVDGTAVGAVGVRGEGGQRGFGGVEGVLGGGLFDVRRGRLFPERGGRVRQMTVLLGEPGGLRLVHVLLAGLLRSLLGDGLLDRRRVRLGDDGFGVPCAGASVAYGSVSVGTGCSAAWTESGAPRVSGVSGNCGASETCGADGTSAARTASGAGPSTWAWAWATSRGSTC